MSRRVFREVLPAIPSGAAVMSHVFDLLSNPALGAPFLAIVGLLFYYSFRRANCRRRQKQGKNPGFCPSSAALGVIFLFVQVFYHPAESHVIAAQLEEQEDQDDQGDPERAAKTLDRQLKRIRRGEFVENLTVHI